MADHACRICTALLEGHIARRTGVGHGAHITQGLARRGNGIGGGLGSILGGMLGGGGLGGLGGVLGGLGGGTPSPADTRRNNPLNDILGMGRQ